MDGHDQYENIEIKEEILDSVDGEHDCSVKSVSVHNDESTDNFADINSELDQNVDGGNTGDDIEIEYVNLSSYEHTVKVEYDDPLCDADSVKEILQNNNEGSCTEDSSTIKNQISNKKKTKSTLSKMVQKCPKCNRDIHVGFMSNHLEKHRREECRKLEREKKRKEARELASNTCQTCNERYFKFFVAAFKITF